jgi:hypothetical protein
MGLREAPGGSTARVGPILRCSQAAFALGRPGAESLRPAQARDPIRSGCGGGGSVCKRIWPGLVFDSLLFEKLGEIESRFFWKQDYIYDGLALWQFG